MRCFFALFFVFFFFLFPDDKIHIDPIEFTFSQHAFEHWSILAASTK